MKVGVMNKRIRKKRRKTALRAAGYWAGDTKGPKVYYYRTCRANDGMYYSLRTARPKSHFKPCAYGWKSVWSPWSIKFGVWTGLPRKEDL